MNGVLSHNGSSRAVELASDIQVFFDDVIGDGAWLRPVPDNHHFAQKFWKHSEQSDLFTVRNAEAVGPNLAVLSLRNTLTNESVELRIHVPEFMQSRQLGCYTVLPMVASSATAAYA